MSAVIDKLSISRRQFLIAGSGVAGSLVLGLPIGGSASTDSDQMIGFFVQIEADGHVIIAAADGHVYSVDVETGEEIWRFASHYSEFNEDRHKGNMCGRYVCVCVWPLYAPDPGSPIPCLSNARAHTNTHSS